MVKASERSREIYHIYSDLFDERLPRPSVTFCDIIMKGLCCITHFLKVLMTVWAKALICKVEQRSILLMCPFCFIAAVFIAIFTTIALIVASVKYMRLFGLGLRGHFETMFKIKLMKKGKYSGNIPENLTRLNKKSKRKGRRTGMGSIAYTLSDARPPPPLHPQSALKSFEAQLPARSIIKLLHPTFAQAILFYL